MSELRFEQGPTHLTKNILWIGHSEADLKGMEVLVVLLYPCLNLPAYFVVDWMGNNCTCKPSTIITFLNEFTLIVYGCKRSWSLEHLHTVLVSGYKIINNPYSCKVPLQ